MRRKRWDELFTRLYDLEDAVDSLTRQVRRIAIAGRYVPRRLDEQAQNGELKQEEQ